MSSGFSARCCPLTRALLNACRHISIDSGSQYLLAVLVTTTVWLFQGLLFAFIMACRAFTWMMTPYALSFVHL